MMNRQFKKKLSLGISLLLAFSVFPTSLMAAPPSTVAAPPNLSPEIDAAASTVLTLRSQLEQKSKELEIIIENNSVLREDITHKTEEKRLLEQAIAVKQQQVDSMQEDLDAMATYYYQNNPNTTLMLLSTILESKDIGEFLSTIEYFRIISEYQSDFLVGLKEERLALENDKERFAIINENLILFQLQYRNEQALIGDEIKALNAEYEKHKKALDLLNASERAQQLIYLKEVFRSIDSTTSISAVRKTVVKTALAQLGKPYIWAAAGPDSFDCSGLILYCYNRIGISLIHHARDQYRVTKPITIGQLQPGDLVFIGTSVPSIHHVMMYIGNGYTVEAPHTGGVVEIRKLDSRLGTIAGFSTVFLGLDTTD